MVYIFNIFLFDKPLKFNGKISCYNPPEADLEEGVRGVRPPKIRKANVIQR
jgi:hypothetical protein